MVKANAHSRDGDLILIENASTNNSLASGRTVLDTQLRTGTNEDD